jgi:hypothetical protein
MLEIALNVHVSALVLGEPQIHTVSIPCSAILQSQTESPEKEKDTQL